MKILFAFENCLPSAEADAEVFMTTARYLAPLTARSWMHGPVRSDAGAGGAAELPGIGMVRALAPARPAALRHLFCGLTIARHKEFREADLVYTRNLWVAWMAILFGQRVAFDHYRPWPDQIPPLQPLIHWLMGHDRFLVNICHSDYTRAKYLAAGVAADKLVCIHNGFEPARLQPVLAIDAAKLEIGVDVNRKTVVYTGRLNHKKGLSLVIAAARRLPDVVFILVGSYGDGPIEVQAGAVANIRVVPWQPPDMLRQYIFAADVLLIPPSWKPLAEFGSTVLPLKLFLYMASGRPILAGATPDITEMLVHNENALLCQPDDLASLLAGIEALTQDASLGSRLGAAARAESTGLTWDARVHAIADVLRLRLSASPAGPRSRFPTGAWLRQSRQWLLHLVRTGSWVLPPRVYTEAAGHEAVAE